MRMDLWRLLFFLVPPFAVILCSAPPALAIEIGERAPEISRKDLQRERFKLSDIVGADAKSRRTAVILVFAETKREESKRELNDFSKLDYEWSPLGVEIVHIGVGASAARLAQLVAPVHIPWRAISDRKRKISVAYGVQKAPYMVVLNTDGVVTYTSDSFSPDRYEEVRRVLVSTTKQAAPWGDVAATTPLFLRHKITYTFGRPPSSRGTSARWQPLAAILENAAYAHLKMVGSPDYEAFEARLQNGDFALANASPALAHSVLSLYEPIAGLERQRQNAYRGIIFVKRDSDLRKLASLRDKTIAMVSPRSTSGGVYAFDTMMRAGLEPGIDFTVKWVGSHENVAEAVRKGEVDGGACYEGCRSIAWGNDAARDRETLVIARTETIPADMIVVRRDLPERVKKRLRRVINSAEVERVVLGQISIGETEITGIGKASDKSLVGVGRLLKRVGPALEKELELSLQRKRAERDF